MVRLDGGCPTTIKQVKSLQLVFNPAMLLHIQTFVNFCEDWIAHHRHAARSWFRSMDGSSPKSARPLSEHQGYLSAQPT